MHQSEATLLILWLLFIVCVCVGVGVGGVGVWMCCSCSCSYITRAGTVMPLRREGKAAKDLELRRVKKAQKTGAERVQGSKTKALTSLVCHKLKYLGQLHNTRHDTG